MKRLLLLATGGTIASQYTEKGLSPQISDQELLSYVPEARNFCEIEAIQPFNLDSTNVSWPQWLQLAALIEENYEKYDGFVICHGTDTMAYTGAALSYLIQNNDKPVVITGSQKPIDPSRYREKKKGSQGINKSLDKLQFDLMKKFVQAKKPVLGICRGMQLINVYFGGSLNQNIKNHRGRWHTVRNVGKNSWIYNLYKKNYKVYSSHHQSVKRLGKNLTITQKAPDGTVEALQHKTLPIYGVQWHPENMGKQGIPVFRGFIKICR